MKHIFLSFWHIFYLLEFTLKSFYNNRCVLSNIAGFLLFFAYSLFICMFVFLFVFLVSLFVPILQDNGIKMPYFPSIYKSYPYLVFNLCQSLSSYGRFAIGEKE